MRHKNSSQSLLHNQPLLQAQRGFKHDFRQYAVIAAVTYFFTGCAVMAQSSQPTRFNFGGSFVGSIPRGDFGANAGRGLGAAGTFLYHLNSAGWASVRFDAIWTQYGKETKRVPLSESVGEQVLVDVNTTNEMGAFGVGPEFSLPFGPIRPYVNGAFNGVLFRTYSSVEGSNSDNEDFASTKNHGDSTTAWSYGGGVRIPVNKKTVGIDLDFGFRYYKGGTATYLNESSIIDRPNGAITVFPFRTATPFIVYTIGVKFRIPYSGTGCPRFVC
jgi:hypothetical protein